tara:strand:- start:1341 stop:1910 length:570 start_codon:yes stop_codon:yes gene_type:complete
MTLLNTAQNEWRIAGQASTNTTGNAYDLAYGGTWATGAQNPANRPAGLTGQNQHRDLTSRHAARLTLECNGLRMRFLVSDTADKQVACTVWMWDCTGAPMDALILNPIQAGAAVCETHPVLQTSLTDFFYADTITDTTDNVSVTAVGSTDGIAEIRFDARGVTWIYADFNTAAPSGTDGTDGICLFKEY